MTAKSAVMPWVRVALNILLMVAILFAVAVAASFLVFPYQILSTIAADFLVPVSFVACIWVRKRMIGEPPAGSMSIHAKVCIVLIAAITVSSMLGGLIP